MSEFVVFASKGIVTIVPAHECIIFQKNNVLQLKLKGDDTIHICDKIVGCSSIVNAVERFSVFVERYSS